VKGPALETGGWKSSRNRPAELAEQGTYGERGRAWGAGLAARLASGYPPSEVADQVFHGIRDNRFYIVPAQPDLKARIGLRAQDLLGLRNPTIPMG